MGCEVYFKKKLTEGTAYQVNLVTNTIPYKTHVAISAENNEPFQFVCNVGANSNDSTAYTNLTSELIPELGTCYHFFGLKILSENYI